MRKNKKASKIGTVAAVMASVILSGTTVLAYAPMQTTNSTYSSVELEGTIGFNEVDSSDYFSDYDFYFEDENHNIIPLYDYSTDDSRALLCSHNFKTGYANQHVKNSSGGCTVKVYNAKICTKCNHLVFYDLVSTHTYVTCPH